MSGWTSVGCAALLAGLSACAETRHPPPVPQTRQPSVLDRAVEPAVHQLGGRIGPQGGIEFPVQPPR